MVSGLRKEPPAIRANGVHAVGAHGRRRRAALQAVDTAGAAPVCQCQRTVRAVGPARARGRRRSARCVTSITIFDTSGLKGRILYSTF